MKTANLIVFGFMLYINVSAQDKWCSYQSTFSGGYYELTEICGDTTIDFKQYDILKVNSYSLNDFSFRGSYRLFRRISGDSVFIKNTSTAEKLNYIYSLQLNDTIYLKNNPLPGKNLKVYKVDSVFLFNKLLKRIFLRFEDPNYGFEDIWVEKIGTILHNYIEPGLTPYISDHYSKFSCCYDSKSQMLFAPYDSLPCHFNEIQKFCDLTSTSNTSNDLKAWIESTNMNDKIILHTPFSQVKLAVLNIYGQIVLRTTSPTMETEINVAKLSPGMYFIQMQTGNSLRSLSFVKTQ